MGVLVTAYPREVGQRQKLVVPLGSLRDINTKKLHLSPLNMILALRKSVSVSGLSSMLNLNIRISLEVMQ